VNPAVLVLNAGSSSIKFSVYVVSGPDDPETRYRGEIEGIGARPRFTVRDARGDAVVDEPLADAGASAPDHAAALARLLGWLERHAAALALAAAGHRVVHGGVRFAAPVAIDGDVLDTLEGLVPLAPLHQPHNLAAIRAVGQAMPDLPQVACFDTAFHQTQPAVAQAFALPPALTETGIRRYGFHGLSYEYVAGVLPGFAGTDPEDRVVVAHLGAGASMCAVQGGRSVATTMSFTALDGLPMGTRCGAIDPGVILYLLAERGLSVAAVTDLLYRRSGLVGVSGVSSDMRDLLASRSPRAAAAIELFVYRVTRELGSLMAALGGLDALVFTGGIGQHAAPIRARVCERVAWTGVRLDPLANERGGPRISTATSPVSVWVIPTDEERVIARHTRRIVGI
jgi:acetate kinase